MTKLEYLKGKFVKRREIAPEWIKIDAIVKDVEHPKKKNGKNKR